MTENNGAPQDRAHALFEALQLADALLRGANMKPSLVEQKVSAALAMKPTLPQDVIELVIAARIVAFEDQSPEALHDLGKAVEPFGERVRWDNQPDEDQEPTP